MSIFSFLDTRKKANDLSPYMRRLCDLTVPNLCNSIEQGRTENRYNRSLPVLLCAWKNGRPPAAQALFAITKDLSDRGLSVITQMPLEGEFIVAFALPETEASEPWYFLGEACRSRAIGGGFWTTGIELSQFVTGTHRRDLAVLQPLAIQLRADTANKYCDTANS